MGWESALEPSMVLASSDTVRIWSGRDNGRAELPTFEQTQSDVAHDSYFNPGLRWSVDGSRFR